MKAGRIVTGATFAAAIGLSTAVVALMGPRSTTGLTPVASAAGEAFVNWENHPIHSLEITPGGDRLLLANTPAGTLEVFDITGAGVSCSQANTVLVFDPNDLAASPQRLTIDGEDPRAMAVSADGSEVYVAIFESGNATTILGGGSTLAGAGFRRMSSIMRWDLTAVRIHHPTTARGFVLSRTRTTPRRRPSA
jgi:DNA-binding beta-propeller fold protein YncE